MSVTSVAPIHRRQRPGGITPPLQSGDHLSAREFLRRYEAMPEVKKAELIDGKEVFRPNKNRSGNYDLPQFQREWC